MKNVKIKYNPYMVETEISVDGQKPKANSALNVGKNDFKNGLKSYLKSYLMNIVTVM